MTAAIVSNIENMGEPIGLEKGYFLKQGIDLKITVFNSGNDATKALQANEAQAANQGLGALATARTQGIKAKGIWLLASSSTDLYPDGLVAIVATAASGIKGIPDLAGKKIATTPGVTPDFYLKAVLARAGIPESKVELLPVQPPNMLAALQGGMDAGVGTEPYPELFLAKLPGSQLVVRGGGYVAKRSIVIMMDEWLSANRSLAERFAAGMAEATQFMRQHPDEASEISARWISGVEVPVVRKALGHVPLDVRMAPIVQKGWEAEVSALVDRGALKQMVPFDEGMDAALIESVQKQHPEFFSDLKPLS
jgi:ABC-type nitrate/sulfonate/bicarbonate transport system substrate-binding protein